MRIVAGRLGGRRLRAPRGRDTRPTSDRVREALFSMLGPLDGARVLDLFAGSGALGIEALSRGAQTATFVERDGRAVEVMRANLEALGLGEDEVRCVRRPPRAALRDASRARRRIRSGLPRPAVPARAGAGRRARRRPCPPCWRPPAAVVAESDRRAPLELDLPVDRERRYGDTLIRIHLLAPDPRIAVCPGLLRPDHQRPPRRHRARRAALRRGRRRRRQPSGAQEQDALRDRGAPRLHRRGDRAPGQRPRRAVRRPRRRLRAPHRGPRDRQGPARDLRLRVRAGDEPAQPPCRPPTSRRST